MAVAALFASLALFWLSTRQWRTRVRALTWIGGAAALAIAVGALLAEPAHFGLLRALADALAHWDRLEDAVLVQAAARNIAAVANFFHQTLDLFVVMTGAVAAVALWALTPGDRVERVLRPTIFAVGGFAVGAFTALGIVAAGFGGQGERRVYIGEIVDARDVRDGDTFWIGATPLRLWGVDAPELNQVCRGVEDCGEKAKQTFLSLAHNGVVRCETRENTRGRVVESFGRPLVQCFVRRDGATEFDLGAELIRAGYAVPYQGEAQYGYDDEAAEGRGRGVMTGCSLRPDVWRRNRAARTAFRSGAVDGAWPTMGACP